MTRRAAVAFLSVWTAACQEGTFSEATLALTHEGVSVSVQRHGSHPFLAEYERTLVVRAAGKPDLVLPMLQDTGGTTRINVYQSGMNTILLLDRFGLYRVRLGRFSAEAVERTPPPTDSVFLGAFDQEDGEWTFIHAVKRKELPVEKQSAG